MGISGHDGVFRKTCERTIDILRQNEKTIMTILEVLLYDPLYMWSIGAKLVRKKQLQGVIECYGDRDGEVNMKKDTQAARALQRVCEKLKGTADYSSAHFPTIEGQVQYLIQSATNPSNLSRLFRGWQAFL
jgi:serine-protein kinase ATM